jgi:hypothetical protein
MFSLSIYLNTNKKTEISTHGSSDNIHHWVTIGNSDINDVTIFVKTKEQAERVANALRNS